MLQLLDKSHHISQIEKSHYMSDNIPRLDWYVAKDWDREWVKYFMPFLSFYLALKCDEMGYNEWFLDELWFQQYDTDSTHGWHTHGSNFTGVYYLEFPDGAPKTQLVDEEYKVFEPDIKEGDILIFPSFIHHRGPINNNNKRKTIISFNLNMLGPSKNTINKIMKVNNLHD